MSREKEEDGVMDPAEEPFEGLTGSVGVRGERVVLSEIDGCTEGR